MGVSWPVSQRNFWLFPSAVRGYRADGIDGFLVRRIVGILGNKSAVALHRGDLGFRREVRDLFHAGDALRAVLTRRQTDGQRSPIEIVNLGAGSRADRRRGVHAVFVQSLAEVGGRVVAGVPHRHLTSGKSQIVHAFDRGAGLTRNAEDDAQPHPGLRRSLLPARLPQTARGGRVYKGSAVIGFHWRRFYPGETCV